MVETVERSLTRLLEITDDRYELLVVDGRSTDGSQEILRRLAANHERVRLIERDRARGLAADRNLGVREARGDYIFLNLDADDYYHGGIRDFAEIFHQFDEELDRDFVLSGPGLALGKKSFLLKYGPYRPPLHRGEDHDLWRRLAADNSFFILESDRTYEPLGYRRTIPFYFWNKYSTLLSEARGGISFRSNLLTRLKQGKILDRLVDLVFVPTAYIHSMFGPRYGMPAPYDQKDRWPLDVPRGTLEELEEVLGVDVELASLSSEGRQIFAENQKLDSTGSV